MVILHIGFGKSGTTSLQKHVLPQLPEMGLVNQYNPVAIKDSLGRFRRGDTSEIQNLQTFFSQTGDQKTIISLESLIGWNPAIWQERLRMNRAAFPEDTTILITLRDPEGFMRSFYQQNLHQGHVIPPEMYFLTQEVYDAAHLTARPQIAEVFNVDAFHYRTLIQDYARLFKKVVVLPAANLNDLAFLPALDIHPNTAQLAQLRQAIQSGSVENRSYSQTAMALTIWREKLFNSMGLKTLSSYDHDYRIRFLAPPPSPRPSLPRRVLRKLASLVRLPRWRSLMHRGLDRMVPYRSYSLPGDIPRGKYFDDNAELHKKIRASSQGFAVFETPEDVERI